MDSRKPIPILLSDDNGVVCDTLFYQGNGNSQTQALKYVGDQKIIATTGELMWCTGRNNQKPINVIYKLHIGKEIADVNLHPFDSFFSLLNPIKILGAVVTWASNWCNGFHFGPSMTTGAESVVFHAPVISKWSIGQETDMASHREKYDAWLERETKTSGLILWGVSRGTAATFCAFAKEQYPEVKLVVLEGAIDSVENVIPKRFSYPTSKFVSEGLKFFNKINVIPYRHDGPSPLKSVDDFPENIPVVFITSKIDTVVTCHNTENIARTLAMKGKNDVYLLTLERSSHPNYMFDDINDRNCYERFIHAIYKKYNLKHDPMLAKKGEHLIKSCTLCEVDTKQYCHDDFTYHF